MQDYAVQKTARAWDSYKNPLKAVIAEFKPHSVLEYGPGESTKIFLSQTCVAHIDTIEHNAAWLARTEEINDSRLHVCFEQNHYKYPYVSRETNKLYDLIFVDGIERPTCICLAKFRLNRMGIVVVHDAERLEYKKAFEMWPLKYFADEGHTAFLTMDITIGDTLARIL